MGLGWAVCRLWPAAGWGGPFRPGATVPPSRRSKQSGQRSALNDWCDQLFCRNNTGVCPGRCQRNRLPRGRQGWRPPRLSACLCCIGRRRRAQVAATREVTPRDLRGGPMHRARQETNRIPSSGENTPTRFQLPSPRRRITAPLTGGLSRPSVSRRGPWTPAGIPRVREQCRLPGRARPTQDPALERHPRVTPELGGAAGMLVSIATGVSTCPRTVTLTD